MHGSNRISTETLKCTWSMRGYGEGGDDAGDGINDDAGDINDDDGEDGAPVACGCVTTVTGGNRDGVTIRD